MELLKTGVSFMIIGMSVVFLFLVIMIISMDILKVVVGVINKHFPEKETSPSKPVRAAVKDDNAAIAAAIAASFAMSKK